MTQLWTIINDQTGEVLSPAFSTPGPYNHPRFYGWAWRCGVHRAMWIDAQPDPMVQVFDGDAWVEDADLVKAVLVVEIRRECEARSAVYYTAGIGKAFKYASKAAEVSAWRALEDDVGSLEDGQRNRRFPFAAADAALHGDGIPDAIGRFETGMEATETDLASLEATGQVAIGSVQAAVSAPAAREAFALINWDWRLGGNS